MHKILIVEDEPLLRESYILILSMEPYLLEAAANGEEALRLCALHKFDLILLDIMMPIVDGILFLKRAKTMDFTLPKVIIMSNLSSGEELEKAITLGADRTVVKSDLSPRQLISMVRYELQ